MRDYDENFAEALEIDIVADAERNSSHWRDAGNYDTLLKSFFSDLGRTPCLTHDEEYRLTSRARASWQQICTLLTQRPLPVTVGSHDGQSEPRPEQFCEQDVITILNRSETFFQMSGQSGVASVDFAQWLNHLRAELDIF